MRYTLILICSAMVALFSSLPTVQAEDTAQVKDTAQAKNTATSYYLIGNSLTWDTVPSRLDGDVQWHVDCGTSLPFVFKHPEKPCVKSSTLWPAALKKKQELSMNPDAHPVTRGILPSTPILAAMTFVPRTPATPRSEDEPRLKTLIYFTQNRPIPEPDVVHVCVAVRGNAIFLGMDFHRYEAWQQLLLVNVCR